MTRFRLPRPSAAMLVATVALFVALGGTGYAAFSLHKNSVGTKQLENNAVTSKKIENGAVTVSKMNTSGLTVNVKHAITTDEIADGAVTTAKTGLSSGTTETQTIIGDPVQPGALLTVTFPCPAGMTAIGASSHSNSSGTGIHNSYQNGPNYWTVEYMRFLGTGDFTVFGHALCTDT